MKKTLLAAVVGLGLAGSVHAVNYLVNGDFSNGETGWTRYEEGAGQGQTWTTSNGSGDLYENAGTVAWYQGVSVGAGQTATLTGEWKSAIASTADYFWAEVSFFSLNTTSTAAIAACIADPAAIATYGGTGGITSKVAYRFARTVPEYINYPGAPGTWPTNNTWDWESLNNKLVSGALTTINSQGYVYTVLKLGGTDRVDDRHGPHGTLSFDNMNVIPEPASLGLLALGAMAFLGRRRK